MILRQDILEVIKRETSQLIAEMRANLAREGKRDSPLARSIKQNIKGGEFHLSMLEEGVFLDKGVSGKGASNFKGKRKVVHKSLDGYRFGSNKFRGTGDEWEKKIDKWMTGEGIRGGADKFGKKITKESINYLIRRSIYQHGIKSTMFASKAFDGFRERLAERLQKIDITQYIKTSN